MLKRELRHTKSNGSRAHDERARNQHSRLVPRVAGFIILSLNGLRRDEISCGVYGHVYLFIYL